MRALGPLLLFALTALLTPALASGAPPEGDAPDAGIEAAWTQEVVEIRSNFDGAELVLFGAVRNYREGDEVAVVVRGPARDVRVMEKRRTLGIWINRAPIRFEAVPSYYAVASTNALSEFATFSALRRNAIGTDHVRISAPETVSEESRFGVAGVAVSSLGGEIVDYRNAIVRLKSRAGLYYESEAGVEVIGQGLFRAGVRLPPETPVGAYEADVYLFRGGEPVASRRTTLEVRKAGIERAVFELAHSTPLAYGLLAVIMAVLSGWIAAELFRRR